MIRTTKNVTVNELAKRVNSLEVGFTEMQASQKSMDSKLDQILKNLSNSESKSTSSEKNSSSQKKSTKKSSSKKSATQTSKKSGQTWEEHLDEVFGDKEVRTKFVELRNKVAAEFKSLGESEEIWIPKKSYKKVLSETTESLGGKFDKKKVRAAFLKAAK